jgi:restriction system protein
MARRKKKVDPADLIFEGGKFVLLIVVLIGFAAGGMAGVATAIKVMFWVLGTVGGAAIVWIVWKIIHRQRQNRPLIDTDPFISRVFENGVRSKPEFIQAFQAPRLDSAGVAGATDSRAARHTTPTSVSAGVRLDESTIQERLAQIDWFQFEKLNAAMLEANGSVVERKGGAHPDGGVDIIVTSKAGERRLVQCKHWRTWKIKEGTVREMLGAMTHVGATKGEIRTLLGWTAPAGSLAALHQINLLDAGDIARSARAAMSDEQLIPMLDPDNKHCPKCDGPMVLRSGNFKAFWGCRTFPRCRGVIRELAEGAA